MKPSPGTKKGIEYIQAGIESGDFSPATRLPSISILASQAGISNVTMWKAVVALKKKGILEGIKGQRCRVVDQTNSRAQITHAAAIDAPSVKWRRVKDQIEQHLLLGQYSHRRYLPSLKELQQRYGAAYRTLIKSLHALIDDGLLIQEKAGYRITSRRSMPSAHSIAYIGRGYPNKQTFTNEGLARQFTHALESHCSRMQVDITIGDCIIKDAKPFFRNIVSRSNLNIYQKDKWAGYIYYVVVGQQEQRDAALAALVSTKKPVAVMDTDGSWQPSPRLRSSKHLRIFRMLTGQTPGRDMARYLISCGHRKIAFISPFHKTRWSVERLKGIRTAYAAAGLDTAVACFTLNLERLSEVHADAEEKAKLAGFGKELARWKKHVPETYAYHVEQAVRSFSSTQIENWEIEDRLQPLFKKALADKSITAWIAVNDGTAAYAHRFLSGKGKKPGKDISLVGFDNSLQSVQLRFASYDFNLSSTAHAIAEYLMWPQSTFFKASQTMELGRGIIVKRDSVKIM